MFLQFLYELAHALLSRKNKTLDLRIPRESRNVVFSKRSKCSPESEKNNLLGGKHKKDNLKNRNNTFVCNTAI